MKKILIALTCVVAACAQAIHADDAFLNLTPKPKSATVDMTTTYTLPSEVTISVADFDEDWTNETTSFGKALAYATATTVTTTTDANAVITITKNSSLADEGYNLTVSENGIAIQAATTNGLYYAFQTIKKILPANVMAGVAKEGVYEIPYLTIEDEPRYEYRGFMLDCSRHFYTLDEVKRMIDVMSYYKLNYFHWHLTDDQGWRIEMPEYPRLMTIAATAPNSRFTDMYTKTQYWINQPYGPYYYTQDEMRELVAYAAEHHITVVPEVEMPDHLAAAMTAYPEFSCYPDGEHAVWDDGGVSSDVLNVANPAAIQFAKDIIDTLVDIFPSELIHIGGDECPTTAWAANEECQAAYTANGYTNIRQHQSRFCKEMADYAKSKGRRVAFWNETVTYDGIDKDEVKSTDATIYCWYPADTGAETAQSLGLPCVYTPWGPYYINRKQASTDPPAAGGPSDDVKATYERQPFQSLSNKDSDLCFGVQGTFWCEHVSDREYMEWLALPRLIAIAEIGWTPQADRDFTDFMKRVSADRTMLDYNGYLYTEHYMVDTDDTDESSYKTPDADTWYRIITKATDTRAGFCIELDADQGNYLWGMAQEDDNDYQWWKFVEDPDNAEHYAMVCKALPDGSVNSTPENGAATSAKWGYNTSGKDYGFTLNKSYYTAESDGTFTYAIQSDNVDSSWFMNQSLSGQSYRINMWTAPSSGNGGLFNFYPEGGPEETEVEAVEPLLTTSGNYIIANSTFAGYTLADNAGTLLGNSLSAWENNVWTVTVNETNADGSQNVTLVNAVTGSCISSLGDFTTRLGKPVNMGETAATVTVKRYADGEPEASVAVSDYGLWPLPFNATSSPMTVRAGLTTSDSGEAYASQGNAWTFTPVTLTTFNCTDSEGNDLGTYVGGVAEGVELTDAAPVINNMQLVSATAGEDNTVACVYSRTHYTVRYECRTVNEGIIVMVNLESVAPGSQYTVNVPETIGQLQFVNIDGAEKGEIITVNSDIVYQVYYTADDYKLGVASPDEQVTEVSAGKYYLIRDAHAERNAWRGEMANGTVKGQKSSDNLSPMYIWTLEEYSEGLYNIKNYATGNYIQTLVKSTTATTGTTAKKSNTFTFTYNSEGQYWTITGRNSLCWDGTADMSLVGWTSPGHPIEIYEFIGTPFYIVTVTSVDSNGALLGEATYYVAPGEQFVVGAPFRSGYSITEIKNAEGLTNVDSNKNITIVYTANEEDAINSVEAATTTPQAIYDLRGNRLNRISAPGVYIVNGTKVLVY